MQINAPGKIANVWHDKGALIAARSVKNQNENVDVRVVIMAAW